MSQHLPASTSIVMRPVWARRQRRRYHNVNQLPPPTDAEKRDAVKILAMPQAMLDEMPAIWHEAFRILDESGDPE